MAATSENPIIFYDLASTDGEYWSCNTIKTRLTLNYKGLPYRVHYVQLDKIELTLKGLGAPPSSKTFPYYTLPTIADPSSKPNGDPTYVSETFTIAAYLDDKYPAPKYPIVLPPGTRPLQRMFVDHHFPTIGGPLFQVFVRPYIPLKYLEEGGREYLYKSRGGKDGFNPLSEEEASQKLAEIRDKWETLGGVLELNGSNDAAPFVMGEQISFADFAVGGMLFALYRCEGDEGKTWKEVMKWQDGKWSQYWKKIDVIRKKKPFLT